MAEENNDRCTGCKHEEWIRAWQLKEQRKEEIFKQVQANVFTWASVGAIGYLALVIFESFKGHLK